MKSLMDIIATKSVRNWESNQFSQLVHLIISLLEKEYVIINTVARRQLNSYQKCVLALELKPIYQELAKRNSKANLKQNKNKTISSSVRIQTVGNGNGRVDDNIARIAGKSRDTIMKVEYLQTKASIEQSNKLESGTDSIHSVYNDIKRMERRQEIINRANGLASATADHKRYQAR